jgi:hypothetical protein
MRERFAAGRTELLRQLGRLAGSCNSSQVVETVPDLVSGRPAKSPAPIYDDAMTAEILVPARQGDSAALPAGGDGWGRRLGELLPEGLHAPAGLRVADLVPG